MPRNGDELSILGFGCMRLPVGEDGHVLKDDAITAIRYAIDHGVNYLDTAYVYHNGESEVVLGEALKDGYREKVRIATKLPSFIVQSREQMDGILGEQLERLQTDHIDYYLIHNLSSDRWQRMKELGIKGFLDKALSDGRIKYAGFSFHDNFSAFQRIVDGYEWTFCQIQYNYLDEEFQAGTEGLKYAASRGLGIIVMEPLRGGYLAAPIPAARKVWEELGDGRSPVEWGLRWVWDHPEVTVALSGMSSMQQVADNVKYADKGVPGTLTLKEMELFRTVKDIYRERMKVPCTGCGYCMPCPNGISVPECFLHYNNAFMFDALDQEKNSYRHMQTLGFTKSASECAECGQCEEKCPQRIPIPAKLKEFVELFEG